MAPIKGNTNYHTKVKFKIKPTVFQWTGGYEIKRNLMFSTNIEVPFSAVLSSICAGLDVDVYYQQLGETRFIIHTDIASSNLDKRKWLRDISFADFQRDINLDKFIEDSYSLLEPIKEDDHLVGLAALSTWGCRDQVFLNMSTIGGLANRFHCRDASDYIGYMDYIPTSANRNNSQTKVAKDDTLIKWANHQLSLIQSKPSCTKETLLKGQYSLCQFHADPKSIASALILSKENTIILNIEELLIQMDKGYRLFVVVMGLTMDIVDFHLDYSEVIPLLQTNDIVFIPSGTGDFLNLKMENEKPLQENSFIGCLYRKADEMKISLNRVEIPKYIKSYFESDPAWMFTVEKHE